MNALWEIGVQRKQVILGMAIVATIFAITYANFGPDAVPQARATAFNALPNNPYLQQPLSSGVAPSQQITPGAIQQGLGAVVAAVRPAVVKISAHTEQAAHRSPVGMQFLDPFPMGDQWIGSGVIMHPDGYILSSRQVTGDATTVRVKLFRSGNNTFLAHRIATDPATDLTLLKLPFGKNLPHAVMADSSKVRTGDIVLALGSPFGLAETVTQGIVSTSSRTVLVEGRQFNDVIQTDAAINKGNSGGPLVNIGAEVIGVNIAIYSTDASFAGIGFAIPSNQASAFMQRALGLRP